MYILRANPWFSAIMYIFPTKSTPAGLTNVEPRGEIKLLETKYHICMGTAGLNVISSYLLFVGFFYIVQGTIFYGAEHHTKKAFGTAQAAVGLCRCPVHVKHMALAEKRRWVCIVSNYGT